MPLDTTDEQRVAALEAVTAAQAALIGALTADVTLLLQRVDTLDGRVTGIETADTRNGAAARLTSGPALPAVPHAGDVHITFTPVETG
jgi:hypothetical protein